jgi:HTH-type transcriptional regulator/antitoxin HigA
MAQMVKRGWFTGFQGTVAEAKQKAEELIAPLIFPDGVEAGSITCFLRRSVRADAQMDDYALSAWCARILAKAREEDLPEYRPGTVTKAFCRELVHLSFLAEGPALAVEFLHQSGIHLITERHLPRTHLDGASFWSSSERPVIALTLRYDRLDNFWFTLCHELAHVSLHLEKDHGDAFIDDLTAHGEGSPETKADAFAADCLIPDSRWQSSGLGSSWSCPAVTSFALDLRIHPAIVAGRIRREQDNYKILSRLVGSGEVRKHFEPS